MDGSADEPAADPAAVIRFTSIRDGEDDLGRRRRKRRRSKEPEVLAGD